MASYLAALKGEKKTMHGKNKELHMGAIKATGLCKAFGNKLTVNNLYMPIPDGANNSFLIDKKRDELCNLCEEACRLTAAKGVIYVRN